MIMRIEHTAFNVEDPVAMATWYESHLGMRTVRRLDEPPYTRFLADGSGAVAIEIYNNPAAPVPEYAAIDPLNLHLAFSVDDVAATRTRLIEAGATAVGGITELENGDVLAMLRDPWGLPLQLCRRGKPFVAT